MIYKQKGGVTLMCDICKDHIDFDNVKEAEKGKVEAAYVTKKFNGETWDLCSSCKGT